MSETNPPALLANVKRGERITADSQNAVRTAINRLARGVSAPRQVSRKRLSGGGGTSPVPVVMSVLSNYSDYLTCYAVDQNGITLTDEVHFVAKPYMLRNSMTSRNDITFEYTNIDARTAEKESATEDQAVVPSYITGDIIVVQRMFTTVLQGSTPISWQDLNVDARAWARLASA